MDIYTAKSHTKAPVSFKKKRVGKIIFWIWLVCLVLFVLSIIKLGNLPVSDFLGWTMVVLFFVVILLLPVWGFLLGNKLVKILVVIPTALWVIFFVLYLFVLRPHKATGGSMMPNFVSGEYFLSEKVSYYFNLPKRGDVVVFYPPSEFSMSQFYARIVGLPGEYISIRFGHVYINNKVLAEPYLGKEVVTEEGPVIGSQNILIPEGEFAVLGDNRPNSGDSRFYGFIKKSSVTGRVFYVYWPRDRAGFVR